MKKLFKYFSQKLHARRYRRLLLYFYISGLNKNLPSYRAKAEAQAIVAEIIGIDELRTLKKIVDYVW